MIVIHKNIKNGLYVVGGTFLITALLGTSIFAQEPTKKETTKPEKDGYSEIKKENEKTNSIDSNMVNVIKTINMNYEIRDILNKGDRGYIKVNDIDAENKGNAIIVDTKTGNSYLEQKITQEQLNNYKGSLLSINFLEFIYLYGNEVVNCFFYANSLAEEQGRSVKGLRSYDTQHISNGDLSLCFILDYVARQAKDGKLPKEILVPLEPKEDLQYLFGKKIIEKKEWEKPLTKLEKFLY